MMRFEITKKSNGLARAGTIYTNHGDIHTPAFVTVGTKATVKALTAAQIHEVGAQVVLANTYHLYLEPGDGVVQKAGGFGNFMGWHGPTMTDSGGFQAFSLGAAFGNSVSKVAKGEPKVESKRNQSVNTMAKVTEEGVMFRSYKDGSSHLFTPERSMEIQWNLGADMIFAFDECTSPRDSLSYQKEALERTYRWAERSIARHEALDGEKIQALFGVVQGGQFRELREYSAKGISSLPFDGFGIGGSFTKDDIGSAVRWVNEILPEEKPRHLLGIGEPIDLFEAVEAGCDLFDCIAPTRMGRHGTIHTREGKINLLNARFREDFSPLDGESPLQFSRDTSRAYLAHLFRTGEMLAGTIASMHNLHFIITLVEEMRTHILSGTLSDFKKEFLAKYYANR